MPMPAVYASTHNKQNLEQIDIKQSKNSYLFRFL